MAVSYKGRYGHTIYATVSFLDIYPKEMKTYPQKYFIIAQNCTYCKPDEHRQSIN